VGETGGVGEPGEPGSKGLSLKATILKVGHHGSKTSTGDAFLRAAAPRIAVIQVGRNTFGHPTREILEKLRENDIMTYRNDLDGAVSIHVEKGKILEISSVARIQTD
ncbi:MAG: hypothetical protein LBO81_00655, partial [Clostridiales Family XIII bacterium]|nr:hypothetical protein [Clostridiales Family XIII bacterium]